MRSSKAGRKKGTAMALALVIISIASILFLGTVGYITSQLRYVSHMEAKERSLHIADAGLNYYKWYLAHAVEGMYMQEIADFWQQDPAPQGVDAPVEADFDSIGKYSISVEKPSLGSTVVGVTVTGWTYKKPEVKRTVKATLRPRSWSEYALLANSDIEISEGEQIDGLVHSNGGIRFDGVANNEVTSSVETYLYNGSDTKFGVWTDWVGEYNSLQDSEVFLGGKNFPVPVKDFDSVLTSFSLIFDEAQELNFDYSPATKAHQIILKGDKIDVNRVINEKDGKVTQVQNVVTDAPLPDVAAIYVNKNIWIEGSLGSGKKLVVASNNPSVSHGNIYISNDVTYEDYVSGTVLGLVAKNDIGIVEDSEDDLRIDAAMLAQIGKVGREDYGDSKSTLTIHGAIATNQGYGFAGYQNVVIGFDSNLLLNPPPFFPIEGVYRTDFWNEIKE
ncbi:MAG: hypothetical protein UY41_C0004G0010 [Candidatus Moranbacteria bacterium GW2011_GWE1_49_15]|nr:MAG: hypothetical protein UX75_C0005G0012 [Candidatus Moranbacteria bacterium GW2011_GWE2_47_10]KKW07393.1 MAG: hypothetical protein UY41_C0004G0010 [Candidatus Moranbacteria bacterium GW2011_GWE1_49_15]